MNEYYYLSIIAITYENYTKAQSVLTYGVIECTEHS